MPNRYIRASAIESEPVNSLSWQGEVFYRRLLNRVDDFGRFTANIDLLRASIFPLQITKVSVSDTARLLKECEDAGLVFGYEGDGKRCLVVNKAEKGRAKWSDYPNPPEEILSRMKTFTYKRKHSHADALDSDSDSDPGTDADPGSESLRPPASSKGFPSSIDYALTQCSLDAIPNEFVMACYDKALSRGGKDARGLPVENFPAYCRTEFKYERERLEKDKQSGRNDGQSSAVDSIKNQKELERVEARMKVVKGQYEAHQSWSEDDKTEWKKLKPRRDELRKVLGVVI